MGVGVDKSDASLQNTLAKALQSMIDDGSYAALLNTRGLPASSAIARTTVNGAP